MNSLEILAVGAKLGDSCSLTDSGRMVPLVCVLLDSEEVQRNEHPVLEVLADLGEFFHNRRSNFFKLLARSDSRPHKEEGGMNGARSYGDFAVPRYAGTLHDLRLFRVVLGVEVQGCLRLLHQKVHHRLPADYRKNPHKQHS